MTASPTPIDAVPGDVGLPSEEDMARVMMAQFYADWFAPGKIAHNGSVYWDFVNGSSAWKAQAERILSLIRPAFEAKERDADLAAQRAIGAEAARDALLYDTKTEQGRALAAMEARALSAEAKLKGKCSDIPSEAGASEIAIQPQPCASLASADPDNIARSQESQFVRAASARGETQ